jgi:hypothetical protein
VCLHPFVVFGAEGQSQGLIPAKYMPYHWATPPAPTAFWMLDFGRLTWKVHLEPWCLPLLALWLEWSSFTCLCSIEIHKAKFSDVLYRRHLSLAFPYC